MPYWGACSILDLYETPKGLLADTTLTLHLLWLGINGMSGTLDATLLELMDLG